MTAATFLSVFELASLLDLPDIDKLEDAGLLTKDHLLAGEIPLGIDGEADEESSSGDAIDEPEQGWEP